MVDKLKYLSDITIQDWALVKPAAAMGDKKWSVRNDGTNTWGSGYQLVHDSGDTFGASVSIPLPALKPGETGTIIIPNLVAPKTAGIYKTFYVPKDANGIGFTSKLSIIINVSPNAAQISETVLDVTQDLSEYGITFRPANWSDTEALMIWNMVSQSANRLHAFALSKAYSPTVIGSSAQIFQRFFPHRNLERDSADFRTFSCDNPRSNPINTCKAYAWNSGLTITMYNRAMFQGTQPITKQSIHPEFHVTFSSEFLILHELAHSHPWSAEFLETSKSLPEMITKKFPHIPLYGVDSSTVASAGFQHAARSTYAPEEMSTDAISNWFKNSFTNDEFGDFRRKQLDKAVENWLTKIYGSP